MESRDPIETVARFIGAGLGAGDTCVVIATPDHRRALAERLQGRGLLDLAHAAAVGAYVPLDAAETLSRFMFDGRPDERRFDDVVGSVIEAARRGTHPRVRIFGEMVALLCDAGKRDAAVRLRELWNTLGKRLEFALLCSDPDGGSFRVIGEEHICVFPSETHAAVDITVARQAEEAQRRLAAIVESSDDAIIGKTLQGIVTNWNRGAERIFGYTAEEMIGQSITRLIPLERQHEEAHILATIGRGERIEHSESERIRKDGSRISVSLTISPIRDASGHVVGASKVARDVTERKLAEAERERLFRDAEHARADAEAANRAKDEFLSVVSHELRTPLAAILGWVGVLKAGAAGERAARALDTIERSGRAQAKLIEDLLDASRMITGKLRLDLRLVDPPTVMRQAVDAIRPTADAKGVRIQTHLDPTAGPVAGDADRLQQVAWNLLTNAVKFTPSGGLVEVVLQRRDADVQLVVRDTGRGIARAFLPFIFERFRQFESPDVRRTGGLGLGLAIVRHIVELHGGSVSAASDGEDRGATFTVTLPVVVDREPVVTTAFPPERR